MIKDRNCILHLMRHISVGTVIRGREDNVERNFYFQLLSKRKCELPWQSNNVSDLDAGEEDGLVLEKVI